MKKLFLMIAILTTCLYAGSIQNDREFQQAVETMGHEKKLVLMIYTTADCPECAYMKHNVLMPKQRKHFWIQT
jgi:thioredoxin-related protein